MNDYIYSIYDRLAARYGSPFAACNDMVAARLALMIKGGYNKAFDGLFRIGIFSNSSGTIEACEPVDISDTVDQVVKLAQLAEVPDVVDNEEEVCENG